MTRRLLVALLGLILTIGAVVPAQASTGAGAIILQFPTGARFNALGESGTALAQDAAANWFNPGGLAFVAPGGSNAQFMYSKLAAGLADDIRLLWAGYAGGFEGGGFGFSFTYLDMGTQIATDEEGIEKGEFQSYELALQGGMAFQLTENAGVGIGAKYFRDKLANDQILQDKRGGTGDSYGVDLGLLYKIRGINLNLAAVASNLGFNNEIVHVDADQGDPMPRKFTVGAAWAPPFAMSDDFMAILVGDYQLPLLKYDFDTQDYGWGFEKSQEEWGYGLEVNIVNTFAPRVGWKSAKYGDINGLTWGFGFDLTDLLDQSLQFAFASVPQASGLDSVKRFSMSFVW